MNRSTPHTPVPDLRPPTPSQDDPRAQPTVPAPRAAAREDDPPLDAGAIEYASWLRLLRWPHA